MSGGYHHRMRKISARTVAVALALLAAVPFASCDAGFPPEPIAPVRDDGAAAAGLPLAELRPAFPRLTFTRPVDLQVPDDGTNRIFVVEQAGRILVFENRPDVERAEVFLDIREQVRDRHNEEGLLTLAFHPDYRTNGRFFVYYTASDPRRGVLSRFTTRTDEPGRALATPEEVILEIGQPDGNHNGATAAFGPDGYLYLSLGDGGSANDPHRHGQDLSTLLATILRIDVNRRSDDTAYAIPPDNPFVDRPGARGEIWAYGLRNVWRMSFDPVTGELWAGDVGQNRYEEIDLITKGGNYGWNIREGMHDFASGTPADPMIDPIVEYPRSQGISVTGGVVCRDKANPRLHGAYLYADYVSGRVWALRHKDGKVTAHREIVATPGKSISSFGYGPGGEVYVCAFDRMNGTKGRLYQVVERDGG